MYLQRLTITAVRNASGEITHYVGDGQDLTLQKQAETLRATLVAARAVQRNLLPSSFPCLPGFDIAAALYPADEVRSRPQISYRLLSEFLGRIS